MNKQRAKTEGQWFAVAYIVTIKINKKMKKLIIACAAVLALGMMSCQNTKMCYQIDFKVDGKVVATYYQYGTSADIDAYIAQQKKIQEVALGTQAIEVVRNKMPQLLSEEDCRGGVIIDRQ